MPGIFFQVKIIGLLTLCQLIFSAPAFAEKVAVIDDSGRELELEKPATRIISLSPHATELIFAAGAGKHVIGVDSYSDFPPEVKSLPRMGAAGNINLEAIVASQPDLVVAWKSGNTAARIDRLISLGIPVFYSEPTGLDDIATNILRLGILAGSQRSAESAAESYRLAYRELSDRYSHKTPIRAFYQIWHQPLITIGGTHIIDQVIELCGGKNIFADINSLAPTVNPEAVLGMNPQIIIASGKAGQRPQWLQSWGKWPQISAVRHNNLYIIEPDLIQRQSPRILAGAKIMCRQMTDARDNLRSPGIEKR